MFCEYFVFEYFVMKFGMIVIKFVLYESVFGFDVEFDLSVIEIYVYCVCKKIEGSGV